MSNATHANTHSDSSRAHIISPNALLRDIDALVGPRRRSEFFVASAAKEVRRVKLLNAFDAGAGVLKDGDFIPEWDTLESTLKWINDGRAESDRARNV